jgi:DNA mismatch repair ATPase MutL
MNHRRLNHQTRVRRLSVPKVFRLPLDLSPLFEQNAGRLAPIGFEVEAFGDGDLAMKGFPEGLSELGSVEALLGVLRAWAELGPADSANSERAAQVGLAEIAMRGTSRETALADAQAFLRENPCPDPSWVSPRGRQILYRVDFGILDKHFERTRPATGEFS